MLIVSPPKISMIFNKVVYDLGYNYFNHLELDIGNDQLLIDGETLRIGIDRNNEFIREMNEKALEFIFAFKLFTALDKKNGYSQNDFISAVHASKTAISKGYSEQAFEFFYLTLLRHPRLVLESRDFLSINLPWLSFWKLDDYNSSFLYDMLSRFDCNNFSRFTSLFDVMKKNLNAPFVVLEAENLFNDLK